MIFIAPHPIYSPLTRKKMAKKMKRCRPIIMDVNECKGRLIPKIILSLFWQAIFWEFENKICHKKFLHHVNN